MNSGRSGLVCSRRYRRDVSLFVGDFLDLSVAVVVALTVGLTILVEGAAATVKARRLRGRRR